MNSVPFLLIPHTREVRLPIENPLHYPDSKEGDKVVWINSNVHLPELLDIATDDTILVGKRSGLEWSPRVYTIRFREDSGTIEWIYEHKEERDEIYQLLIGAFGIMVETKKQAEVRRLNVKI